MYSQLCQRRTCLFGTWKRAGNHFVRNGVDFVNVVFDILLVNPWSKFLGKEIPEGPIPHDNKTGDKNFIEEYIWKSEFFKVKFCKVFF